MADFETREPVSKEVLEAIDIITAKNVSHARFNPSITGAYVTVYRRDTSSPSGVMLIRGFKADIYDEAVKVSGANISLLGPR